MLENTLTMFREFNGSSMAWATLILSVITLTGCSYGYEVLMVNESDRPIEVRYRITSQGEFDKPLVKHIDEWNSRNSIERLWKKERPWESLPEDQYQTVADERVIKMLPREVVRIERGHYNPISEEKGELTDIAELKIISSSGEISMKGRLLLSQFEKHEYTYFMVIKDELTRER